MCKQGQGLPLPPLPLLFDARNPINSLVITILIFQLNYQETRSVLEEYQTSAVHLLIIIIIAHNKLCRGQLHAKFRISEIQNSCLEA